MEPVIWLIHTIITLYIWILIGQVVLSWLVTFKVVNTQNPIVNQIGTVLYRLTEPVLGPIRRLLPNLGGLDISPIIAVIALIFIEKVILEILGPAT
jgi:YggT family protein